MKKIHDDNRLTYYKKKFSLLDYFQEDVSEEMILFRFKPGDYLYKDGDYLNYFLFFVEGKAKVFSRLSNGKSLLLSFYKPLEILGDIELFNNDHVTVNVKTITESYCVGLHIDYVRRHLLQDTKFLHFLCQGLGSKLNRCSNNSAINLLYPLENRLASYIVGIETEELAESKLLTLYDSLTEISELLGTSYRHLHRTINSFVDKGILTKVHRGYMISDKNPLDEMAHDLYSRY